MDRQLIVQEQIKIRDAWCGYFKWWYGVHYTLGVLSVLLSTLIAAKPASLGLSEDSYELIAFLMAAVAGVFTFLKPGDRGDRYRRAWTDLNTQLTLFQHDQAYTLKMVIDAYVQGEAIIHQSTSPAQTPSPSS